MANNRSGGRRATLPSFLCSTGDPRSPQPERRDIGLNGLRVLTPELLEQRLRAARREGILSDEHLASLRTRNQAGDSNRRDRLALCFSRGLLEDEGGMKRLFRSWGGEALYNSHEDDAFTGPALMAIGRPCIIVAAASTPRCRASVVFPTPPFCAMTATVSMASFQAVEVACR
jgi:hypothetical protein